MRISLSTYNILFNHDPRLMESLRKLKKDGSRYTHSIVALQEVRNKTAQDKLPETIHKAFPKFSAATLLHPKPTINDFGLMTLSSMKLIDSTPILLPVLPKHLFSLQAMFFRMIPQQGALVTRYKVGNKILRVTNLHLDVLGGTKHKRKQMKHICKHLAQTKADYDIVCGDFNTIGPIKIMRKRIRKQRDIIRETLGASFKEVFVPSWTSDIRETMNPQIPANRLITRGLNKIGISFRQKLDWIFVRGFRTATAIVRHDLVGSDHYPIIATLTV